MKTNIGSTVIIIPERRVKLPTISATLLKTKRRYDRWFGLDLRVPTVVIFKDRRQVGQFWGRSLAWTTGRFFLGTLYILDRKTSGRTKKNWFKVLQHEHAHMYIGETCRRQAPKWLNEGLAYCLAGQYEAAKWARVREYFLAKPKHPERIVYNAGSTVVRHLLIHYGRKRLLNYLRALQHVERSNDWKRVFRRVYGLNWNDFLEARLPANTIRPDV